MGGLEKDCGKTKFFSESLASQTLEIMRQRKEVGLKDGHTYFCPACYAFHVSSQSWEKTNHIRATMKKRRKNY